jgi:hypothetical protein
MENNLDLECARIAGGIVHGVSGEKAKELDKAIGASLAVLQSDGLYGLFVYLGSRKKEPTCENILKHLDSWGREKKLLAERKPGESTDFGAILTAVRTLSTDLPSLFLTIDLFERALVYARYHAKAQG